MARCMFGTKPLPELMLTYCQLDLLEETSMKFQSEFKSFHWRKCIGKGCLQNVGHFASASIVEIWESAVIIELDPYPCFTIAVLYIGTLDPVILNQCWIFGIDLTHWGQDKMAAMLQTTFFNAFSSMKMFELQTVFLNAISEFCFLGPIDNLSALV